ncbi:hypothetical protein [Egbenema bharatensis]|uniref:hypothetical protein n=1 Tax=Egbenema bharatensis TaxID=3463334 RepID=UPI003A869081
MILIVRNLFVGDLADELTQGNRSVLSERQKANQAFFMLSFTFEPFILNPLLF